MGTSDEPPEWVSELQLRRLLWQEFGLPFDDMTAADIVKIVAMHNGEANRKKVKYGR